MPNASRPVDPPPPCRRSRPPPAPVAARAAILPREVPKEWVKDPVHACVQRRPSTRVLRREWSTGTGSLAGGEINNMQTTHRKFPIKKKKKFKTAMLITMRSHWHPPFPLGGLGAVWRSTRIKTRSDWFLTATTACSRMHNALWAWSNMPLPLPSGWLHMQRLRMSYCGAALLRVTRVAGCGEEP